jgi:predicted ferric reductase
MNEMATRKNDSSAKTPYSLKIYRVLLTCCFLVFLGAALAVPFYYETQTLWYKTGLNKVMLRAGQLAGLFTLVLLVLQIILALRGRFFEDLFGDVKNLLRWHRTNGVLIAGAALCHVILVLAPDGISNLPIGTKYWPEMVGEGLFLLLLATVLSSHFRAALRLDYTLWRRVHRPLGYLLLVLVLIHVLFVSESFTQGLPRIILLAVFAGLALLAVVVKRGGRNPKT